MTKLIIWATLKRTNALQAFSNTEKPERPQKSTKVDDRKIISTVMENYFTTSKQVNIKMKYKDRFKY